MDDDLATLVRTSCRRVVERARLVTVVPEAVAAVADDLATAARADDRAVTAPPPAPSDPEAAVALVLALDAVNFGSGWHDVVRKRPGMSGARTMAAGLRDHVARTGPLTADRLRAIGPRDCTTIFGQQDAPAEVDELMAHFAAALDDLGGLVQQDHGGSFLGLVEASGRSAVALAGSLLRLPAYRDRAVLDGDEVHLYKRAQITPADLAREVGGVAACRFTDLDRLTAFADNLVPHVLRVDGALRYHPDLAAAIDAGTLLEPGSRAEIEIRAAGVDTVERLVAHLGDRGARWRAMDVDQALWQRGQGARYKAVRRHRARSTWY